MKTYQHFKTESAPALVVVSFFILFLAAGCFIFDGDGQSELDDPCKNVSHRFVTQHSNGLGVTSGECRASERGEWIDGRCYCHGES